MFWRTCEDTTSSAHNFLQSRLPRGLRGPLRSSAPSAPARFFARAFSRPTKAGLFGKKQSAPAAQDLTPPDQGGEDFEFIGHEDIPIEPETDLKSPIPDTAGIPEDLPAAPVAPSPSASKSLFRFKNLSKASLHLSIATDRASSCPTRTTEESDLYLAFPQPPTHIPTSIASAYRDSLLSTSTRTDPPLRDIGSSPTESNPFSSDTDSCRDPSVSSPPTSEHTPESIPNTKPPVSAIPWPENPAKPRHRFSDSFRRFKSFSQILRESFVSHLDEASPSDTVTVKGGEAHDGGFSSEPFTAEPTVCVAPFGLEPPRIPALSPFVTSAVEAVNRDSQPALVSFTQVPPSPSVQVIPAPPRLRRRSSAPVGRVYAAKYELVNPSQLTASPSPLVDSLLVHSARSSLILPSPSWLSRNVQHLDTTESQSQVKYAPSRISALSESAHLRIPESAKFFPSALFAPDSPRPLPIPPPVILVPPPHPRSPYRPSLQRLVTDIHPPSPDTDAESFVTSPTPAESTLYSPHSSTTIFATAFPSPSQATHRRLTSVNRINIERQRNIIAQSKKNRLNTPRTRRRFFAENRAKSVNPVFKDISCGGAKLHLVKAPPSPLAGDNSSDDRTIFFPSLQAKESPTFKPSPLPKDLAALLEAFFIQSGIINSFAPPSMDYIAKNVDVVDFGGEADYTGHQWFQEPPPRPEPQPVVQPYIPDDDVIRQNNAFDFALKAAPNVLYGRFKQYGQLGVLAWCSEFGEMIDSLKELGFSGNMFVATRAQALKTCEDILGLKLDIRMQIILLYLSSQVARLRRFLDGGERQWDDYPASEFPVDYRTFSS